MRYESHLDLRKEAEFVTAIAKRFNCYCHKLPIEWRLDMLMHRNGYGIGWGEIKIKNVALKDIPDVYLNKDKYEFGLKMRRLFGGEHNTNLPFVLFLQCDDGQFRCNLSRQAIAFPTRIFTASNHKEDPTDTKEVLMIPSNLFKEF